MSNAKSNTIIVTGASSGIGKALTLKLVEKNKKVLAVARNLWKLQQLKALNPAYIDIISADVGTEEGREKIINHLPNNIKISAIVHNAGIMSPSGYLDSIDLAEWRYQMAVNVEGPLFLTKGLLPVLTNARVLHITIYSSFRVTVGLGAYGISKAALNMLTEYFRVELKKYGILVGLALPGIVNTNIQKQIPQSSDIPLQSKISRLIAENKLLSPETAAAFLSWLLLDTTDDQFTAKTWDIYDTDHHKYWASNLIIPTLD